MPGGRGSASLDRLGNRAARLAAMPELLTAFDAFLQEHRRYGELANKL